MSKFFTIAIIALSINALAQIPPYVPSNGLVSWYSFAGNANDLSGNNNNGTVIGATLTNDRFGNPNSAYSFNGTNNWISVSNSPSLNVQNYNGISLSGWVKFSSLGTQPLALVGLTQGDGQNINYMFTYSNSSFAGFVLLNYPNVEIWAPNNATNNTWYFVVVTSDFTSNISNLYVNGQFIVSSSNTLIKPISPVLNIGQHLNYGPWWMNGVLDDIGVWNRALTQTEITDLYNGNICYTYITVTDTLIINANFTGFNPVTYANTIKVYPNPTFDHITIDCGNNFSTLSGYTIKITNSLSQTVYTSLVTQQVTTIDLNSWTGNGIYFIHLIDANNNTIDIKKIILQ